MQPLPSNTYTRSVRFFGFTAPLFLAACGGGGGGGSNDAPVQGGEPPTTSPYEASSYSSEGVNSADHQGLWMLVGEISYRLDLESEGGDSGDYDEGSVEFRRTVSITQQNPEEIMALSCDINRLQETYHETSSNTLELVNFGRRVTYSLNIASNTEMEGVVVSDDPNLVINSSQLKMIKVSDSTVDLATTSSDQGLGSVTATFSQAEPAEYSADSSALLCFEQEKLEYEWVYQGETGQDGGEFVSFTTYLEGNISDLLTAFSRYNSSEGDPDESFLLLRLSNDTAYGHAYEEAPVSIQENLYNKVSGSNSATVIYGSNPNQYMGVNISLDFDFSY